MTVTPFVSPYLKAPLRSLEEVMRERESRRERTLKRVSAAGRPASAPGATEGQKRGK